MKKLLWGLLIYANMGFAKADTGSGQPEANLPPVVDQSSFEQLIVYSPDACQVIIH